MKKKLLIFSIIWFLFIGCILLYARFIGTTGLVIKEYKITNSNFVENFYGLKIVHLTDIHYGRITKKKELDNILKKLELIKPDVVFFTGDLLDKDVELNITEQNELIDFLNNIYSTQGKFIVSGNHDYYHKYYSTIISSTDFVNLDNETYKIYNKNLDYIFLAGLPSEVGGKPNITNIDNFYTSLKSDDNLQKPIYNILLLHTPDTLDKALNYNFNLAVAGHSHNGQVRLPFVGSVFNIEGSKKYNNPYYKIDNTELYISGGIGTSSLNLRLFNRPSFNFYRLTNK